MLSSEAESRETDVSCDPPDSSDGHGGRRGRIEATPGRRGRVVVASGLVFVLLVVVAITCGLFDRDDEAARAEVRRRAVSALELQGVRLGPVRADQLDNSEATLVTLVDEHITNGRVDGELLKQLEELGPQVVSLAQTEVMAEGIGPVVSQPQVWGLSLLGTGIDDDSLSVLEGRLQLRLCLLYTSPSPRDGLLSRMPSSA